MAVRNQNQVCGMGGVLSDTADLGPAVHKMTSNGVHSAREGWDWPVYLIEEVQEEVLKVVGA